MNNNCVIRSVMAMLALFLMMVPARADEGMWLLPLVRELNVERMEQMGCELEAEEIYSHNRASLKDLIGVLDYGSCTAGIISGDGLILTNHHCGEDEIHAHSSSEHDYLTDGFWAMSKEEELPNPGKTISFVVSMEDVTERVMAMVHHEMSEYERQEEIEKASKKILEEAAVDSINEAFVIPFYESSSFYLVVMKTFRDVRLVAAPPESIGRFGGDADNWEWPRHNADFSLMRIYTAPDGSPADYAPENVPYKPESYLPVSTKGYSENDFTLIMGFPGGTRRYLTSERVREIAEIENTNRIRIRKAALELIEEDMRTDDRVRLQYTAKHSRLSNYYKYSIGQNRSISRLQVAERRKAQEDAFANWIEQDSLRQIQFQGVIEQMNEAIRQRREMENALSYLNEAFLLYKAVEVFDFAASARSLYFNGLGFYNGRKTKDKIVGRLKEEARIFFRDFNPPTDRKIASALISQYAEKVEPLYYPGIFSTIHKDFKGDIDRYLEHLYSKSIFTDSSRFKRYMENPRHNKLLKDPAFLGAFAIYNTYFQILDEYEDLENRYIQASRKYQEGLMKMYPDSNFYPDANSTLRLSYGTISGYHARDAVKYDYFTTLSGVTNL